MSSSLKVGSTYSLYTNYETIAGVKVQVIGTLTYSQHSKVSYNITTLAINERVISVKDEDLETVIGTDTIYWCKATTASSDGTYAEYLVWDSIINYDKTTILNETTNLSIALTILDSSSISITQVIATIESAIKSAYSSNVSYTITKTDSSSSTETTSSGTATTTLTDDVLNSAESVINALNALQSTLVPAAEKITSTSLSDTIDSINDNLAGINNSISLIKKGLK